MSKLDFYILDTETTGLKAGGYHEIHEISIIRLKDKMQFSSDILCSYPKRANFDALKLTSKSINDLSTVGKTRLHVVSTINEMLETDGNIPNGRVIIAHNSAFDRRFVQSLWKQCNKNFPAHLWLDTLKMMRQYAKSQNWGKVSLGLENACNILNIKTGNAHTAKHDTRMTYHLYNKLVNEFGVDYLPYIENHPHNVVTENTTIEYDDDDLSLLDDMDF